MGKSKTGAKREKKAGNRFATSCGDNPDLVEKKTAGLFLLVKAYRTCSIS